MKVQVDELPEDFVAQEFGRLLGSEASLAAGPPRRPDSSICAAAFFFRSGELEASCTAHGGDTLSSLVNAAAATCEDARGATWRGLWTVWRCTCARWASVMALRSLWRASLWLR